MGKITGFLEIERHDRKYAPVAERIKHWHEFVLPLSEKDVRDQAARCMDCGVPYCHGTSRLTGAPTAAATDGAECAESPNTAATRLTNGAPFAGQP